METRALVQAVKRNEDRFPPDFMFQLTESEWGVLRSQIVISKRQGGRRYAPYAFTEHGALMLASVLHSRQASDISLLVVRAFVWLRQMVPAQVEITTRLNELETRLADHDETLVGIIEAIRQLMIPPEKERKAIGFGISAGECDNG